MGYQNYNFEKEIDKKNVELKYDLEHTQHSGSDFYVWGVPTCNYPEKQKITVIINGIKPNETKLNYYQILDNKIFDANEKIIKKYLSGSEVRIDLWDNIGRYRVHLWESIIASGYSYKGKIKKYNFAGTIEAFSFGDIVNTEEKEYEYIKFSFVDNQLTFALLDKTNNEIELLNYDKIKTKPTKNYKIKYPKIFYTYSEKHNIRETEVLQIHSDYENNIHYKSDKIIGSEQYIDSLFDHENIESLDVYKKKLDEQDEIINLLKKEIEEEKNKLTKQNNLLKSAIEYKTKEYNYILNKLMQDELYKIKTKLHNSEVQKIITKKYYDAVILRNKIV